MKTSVSFKFHIGELGFQNNRGEGRRGLGEDRGLPSDVQNFENPPPSVGCFPIPFFGRKIPLVAFRQISPKMLLVTHIFRSTIMTYLEKLIVIVP